MHPDLGCSNASSFAAQRCTRIWSAMLHPPLGRSVTASSGGRIPVPGLTGTSCSQDWFYLKPLKWRRPAGPARATGPPGDLGTGRGLGAGPRPLPGGQPGGTGSGAGAAGKDGRGVLSPRFGPRGDTVSCPCRYSAVASRLAMPPCCGGDRDMCHPTFVGPRCPAWPRHAAATPPGPPPGASTHRTSGKSLTRTPTSICSAAVSSSTSSSLNRGTTESSQGEAESCRRRGPQHRHPHPRSTQGCRGGDGVSPSG